MALVIPSTEPTGVMTGRAERIGSGEGHVHVSPYPIPDADSSPQDVHVAFGISEGLRVYVADDFLTMTVGLYEFFMAEEANDALRVYLHLLYTARRQANRSVWANTGYISSGCGMGRARVKVARAWLVEKGVVQIRKDVARGKGGKITGSKSYIVLQTTISPRGSVTEPTGDRTSREPTHEVLREQGKPQENKEHAVAIAPVPLKKAKHSPEKVRIFQTLADVFVSRGGKWQHGAKEAARLYDVIDYAFRQRPDQPEFAALLVEGFWKLHSGELYGMAEREKQWWASVPYVPSRLDAKAVEAMLSRVESANTVSQEYLEQLEKDWGEKIRKRRALEAKV